MSDLGLTHIALPTSNLEASIAFYAEYARMQATYDRLNKRLEDLGIVFGDLAEDALKHIGLGA